MKMMESNFNFDAALDLCNKKASEAREQCEKLNNLAYCSSATFQIQNTMFNEALNEYRTWAYTMPSMLIAAQAPLSTEQMLKQSESKSATEIDLILCKKCNTYISFNYSFCPYCGEKI